MTSFSISESSLLLKQLKTIHAYVMIISMLCSPFFSSDCQGCLFDGRRRILSR